MDQSAPEKTRVCQNRRIFAEGSDLAEGFASVSLGFAVCFSTCLVLDFAFLYKILPKQNILMFANYWGGGDR